MHNPLFLVHKINWKWSGTPLASYLDWSIWITRLFVHLPYDSVTAITDLKLCHPSSKNSRTALSRDTCYFDITVKIYFNPLFLIIPSCFPPVTILQPYVSRPPRWWWRHADLGISNDLAFHSKRVFTFKPNNNNKKKTYKQTKRIVKSLLNFDNFQASSTQSRDFASLRKGISLKY